MGLLQRLQSGQGRGVRGRGEAGDRAFRGLGGNDQLYGGGGKDTLRGGKGKDVLYGDAGEDLLRGRAGDDVIHADDGKRDRVNCGAGPDTVVADPRDLIGRGCEEVNGADEFAGGVLATFSVGDERFRAWVTDTSGIEQLRQMESGERTGGILGGRLVRGPGQGDHNAPYGWHYDPQSVSVADVSVPECQLPPSYAEDHLDEILAGTEHFCPPVELVALRDYTGEG